MLQYNMAFPSSPLVSSPSQAYCNCMEEIRLRLGVVQALGNKTFSTNYVHSEQQLAFLQFRMCLELIAFGSLIANQAAYSAAYKDFSSHWRAKKMLEYLEKVNADF